MGKRGEGKAAVGVCDGLLRDLAVGGAGSDDVAAGWGDVAGEQVAASGSLLLPLLGVAALPDGCLVWSV